MKSIKLMFTMLVIGMIAFTSCSEMEQKEEQTKTTNISTVKGGDFVWVELEDKEKREIVIQVATDAMNGTKCASCRVRCKTTHEIGVLGNSWLVKCDDNTVYIATYCNGTWYVMDGTGYDNYNFVGHPCPPN